MISNNDEFRSRRGRNTLFLEFRFKVYNKEWNQAICNNMDGPSGQCAEWNKSDRERQIPCDFTYTWNLKYNTNKQNGNRLIDTENILTVTRWEGSWEVDEKLKELRSTRWQLRNYRGDLKYSIGNTINNSLITVWCQRGRRLIRVSTK